jgi:hypothetical protein
MMIDQSEYQQANRNGGRDGRSQDTDLAELLSDDLDIATDLETDLEMDLEPGDEELEELGDTEADALEPVAVGY